MLSVVKKHKYIYKFIRGLERMPPKQYSLYTVQYTVCKMVLDSGGDDYWKIQRLDFGFCFFVIISSVSNLTGNEFRSVSKSRKAKFDLPKEKKRNYLFFVELDALCGGIDAFCGAVKSLKEGYEDIKSK